MKQAKFSSLLADELKKTKHRRKGYSLRAMSRDLKIAPSTLSEYLNGRSYPSLSTARKIAEVFKWSNDDIEIIVDELKLIKKSLLRMGVINMAELGMDAESARACILISKLPSQIGHVTDEDSIAEQFGIRKSVVRKSLSWLVENDVLRERNKKFIEGNQRIGWIDGKNQNSTLQLERHLVDRLAASLHKTPDNEKFFLATHLRVSEADFELVKMEFNKLAAKLAKKLRAPKSDKLFQFVLAAVPAEK